MTSHAMNTTIAGSSGLDIFYLFSVTLPSVSILINMILGVPLNGYVIWLILRASRETMASDFFSLNLAVSEFLYALSAMWMLVSVMTSSHQLQRIYYFSIGLPATGRPLFLSSICVEYYMGVIHPVLYLQFKPLRYRVACCGFLWLMILLSCIYNFLIDVNVCNYNYFYFIQNVLLFSLMLFCCLSVLWALKRPGPGDGDTEKRTSSAMKRRAFNIIFDILIFLAINAIAYMALIPLQCNLNALDFSIILSSFLIFSLISGLLQPLFYLQRSGKLPCFSRER